MSLGNRQGAQCVQPGQGWWLESLPYFPGCMEGYVGRGPESESWQASGDPRNNELSISCGCKREIYICTYLIIFTERVK